MAADIEERADSEPASPMYGYMAIGSTVLAAATAPIFIRYAQLEGVPSLYIVATRLWLTVFLMAPFIRGSYWRDVPNLKKADWLWISLGGFLLACNISLLFFTLEYTSVLVSSVLRRTSPLWVIWIEIFFLGAVFHKRVWWGLGLTLVGAVAVAFGGGGSLGGGSQPILGAILALINALTGGLYLLIGRQLRHLLPSFTYSWLVFIVAAVCTTGAVLVTGTPLWGYSTVGYVWIVVITIVAQLFGHIPINLALQYFPATYLSIAMQLSVALSAVLAFFAFQQAPSVWQAVGSVLIVLGVVVVTLRNS